MKPTTKVVLLCCVAVIALAMFLHVNEGFDPALPNDMPPDARFMATGYDMEHNERKGSWVSCHTISANGECQCRITDAHGFVIFQGFFLPVSSGSAELTAPARKQLRWVSGPTEGSPVPIVPGSAGTFLVPRGDRDALLDRWNRDTEEWQALVAGD